MTHPPVRAVVFAYHAVGVRCLSALLAHQVHVPLVVSHKDDPGETIWFDSVADLARLEGIEVICPEDPNTPEVQEHILACQPDFFFSFYYRKMLGEALLAIPPRGGYNMHGSMLPAYRGRVPVNWAVLHGEQTTGATLHRMVRKPDAGEWVDQEAVPIFPNDTAHTVFGKVVCAAERVLWRALPGLLAGTAPHTPLDLTRGRYFGGRRPEDGRIDWQRSTWEIHNLIRAVAPPYPGAFFDLGERRIHVFGSYYREEKGCQPEAWRPCIYWEGDRCLVECLDGLRLHMRRLVLEGHDLERSEWERLFGQDPVLLT
ncbi:MAG: formyltransferase [Magnetococcus sp. YQC-5]